MSYLKYLLFLFISPIIEGFSQISGIICDKTNNLPIEYANLRILGSNKGCYSNEYGIFSINATLNDKLIISHMSYNSDTLQLSNQKNNLIVKLMPHENILQEINVTSDYSFELILGASKKLKNQKNDWWYADNFTRAYNYKKNEPSELNELFSKVQLNSSGIFQISIEKGRYALKNGFMNKIVRNPFELAGAFFVLANPWATLSKYILDDSVLINYTLKIKNFTIINDVKFVNIIFKDNQIEGLITINQNNFTIKKVDIKFNVNEKVAGVSIQGFSKYTVSMLEINDSTNLINGVIEDSQVSFEGFLAPKGMCNKLKLISLNTNFKKEKPINFENNKLKTKEDLKVGNIQAKIDQMGYEDSFWKNNSIIKSTTIDSAFVSSFKNVKSKGNLKFNKNNNNE